MSSSRYAIGIDLGTSNSALAFWDERELEAGVGVLEIAQYYDRQSVQESPFLPSFVYLPTAGEQVAAPLWAGATGAAVVGSYARSQAAGRPGRVIGSAKSWLCQAAVDRQDAILPWRSTELSSAERLSPVAALALILRHLRAAWDAKQGGGAGSDFAAQQVVITVPASFDETAQRLTLAAAKQADYPPVSLLEEPQAAFYHWLEFVGSNRVLDLLPELNKKPQVVLVVDIGGGTTDFSLLEISGVWANGLPQVRRLAVSSHLLLGGDNIDLALARHMAARLPGGAAALDYSQWQQLAAEARGLKEKVLSDPTAVAKGDFGFSVVGRGQDIFAAAQSAEISYQELQDLILEGFFPLCAAAAQPREQLTALQEWGLPYAADTAVTRHLAAFLQGRPIAAVLFNGGALKPVFLRERLTEIIRSWQPEQPLLELPSADHDLAVARGAALFGRALRGRGWRIRADYPRSLYLELAGEPAAGQALCLLPQGAPVGKRVLIGERSFKARVDEPVLFKFWSAIRREGDKAGDIVSLGPDLRAWPPLQTVLSWQRGYRKARARELEVRLEVLISETGMLELYCVPSDPGQSGAERRWRLEFNVRKGGVDGAVDGAVEGTVEGTVDGTVELPGQTKTDKQAEGAAAAKVLKTLIEPKRLERARAAILLLFGKAQLGGVAASPKRLARELEQILGRKRNEWESSLLRELWEPLSHGITRRKRSLDHEAIWLYLAGFCLRPGFGFDRDAHRLAELWRVFELGMCFKQVPAVQTQWWIMWRRTAGGLDREQQCRLWADIQPQIGRKGAVPAELLRLAAALERIAPEDKLKLADLCLGRIRDRVTKQAEHYYWALTRVGARRLLYAPVHCVLPAEKIGDWFKRLADLDWLDRDYQRLNGVFAAIGRRTGDEQRDISAEIQEQLLQKLTRSQALPEHMRMLQESSGVNEAERSALFGEELPLGLRL